MQSKPESFFTQKYFFPNSSACISPSSHGISISFKYICSVFQVEWNGLYPRFIAQSMREL